MGYVFQDDDHLKLFAHLYRKKVFSFGGGGTLSKHLSGKCRVEFIKDRHSKQNKRAKQISKLEKRSV